MKQLFSVFLVSAILVVSASTAEAETDWSVENADSLADCVDQAADHCRNKCDDEYGLGRVDCARSCLDSLEGQCEEYDYGSDEYDSDVANEECEECMDVCEDACDILQQSWRRDNCLEECESRCNDLCD